MNSSQANRYIAPKQIISIWVKHLHPREEIESIGKERGSVCVVVCCVLHCLKEATIYSGSRRQQ